MICNFCVVAVKWYESYCLIIYGMKNEHAYKHVGKAIKIIIREMKALHQASVHFDRRVFTLP